MPKGKVVLVGAGPGDAGLLTIKGKKILEAADVLVYDRLVCEDILNFAPTARRIYVGKEQGFHPVPQEEINAILLREAQAGALVVRLKGGDPYLFGRGAEEAVVLAQNGVPFEVVPGVTSALAVPGYAGIPPTARGKANSVHIITGHPRAGEELDIDFAALCRTKGTLVFLMAVTSMPDITKGLFLAGMDKDTPAAVVENGTLPGQRNIQGTLGTIATLAGAEGVQSPAILVVGAVCDTMEELGWFARLPLFGKTVVVTRPKNRAGTLSGALQELGAKVLPLPCIETTPVNTAAAQVALEDIGRFAWLALTSPQGVQSLFAVLQQMGRDTRALAPVKIAAIGKSTAEELGKHGIQADYVPARYDAVHLAQGLVPLVGQGESVLLLRAENGTPDLPAILAENGVAFTDIPVYTTVPTGQADAKLAQRFEKGEVDFVTFTSASTVQGFAACLPQAAGYNFTAVCIGDSSAAAAKARGYRTVTARNASIEDLLHSILEESKA